MAKGKFYKVKNKLLDYSNLEKKNFNEKSPLIGYLYDLYTERFVEPIDKHMIDAFFNMGADKEAKKAEEAAVEAARAEAAMAQAAAATGSVATFHDSIVYFLTIGDYKSACDLGWNHDDVVAKAAKAAVAVTAEAVMAEAAKAAVAATAEAVMAEAAKAAVAVTAEAVMVEAAKAAVAMRTDTVVAEAAKVVANS